jgi:uncharacterized protein YjbI with pentapeptide repeats
MTGTPTAPTAAPGTSTTQIATTAFVANASGYVVATIAALRLNSTTFGASAIADVVAYASVGDGGGGLFVRATADTTSTDNGGTIIVDAASQRWYRQIGPSAPLNVLWFGAHLNSATDSTAAINNALAVGNDILFPAGYFTITSPITYSFPNNSSPLTISGRGADVTKLLWPTANSGFTINYLGPLNSFHMHDLSLETTVNGTTGAAVVLNQAAALGTENAWNQSDFTNVTIRGSDGPDLTYYWGTGISINGVSGVNFMNLKIDGQHINPYTYVGTGVIIYGTTTIIPVVYNFTNCNFTYLGNGFAYGANTQGVTFSQCNFTGGGTGIIAPSSAAGTVLSQLAVVGCQFNCANYGIYTYAGTSIAAISVSSSYFFELLAGSVGIYLAQTEAFSIMNNVFEGPGGTNTAYGITIGSNPLSFPGVICGNVFFRNFYGVNLNGSSSYVNLQSNGWSGNTNNYYNGGTSNTIGGGSA